MFGGYNRMRAMAWASEDLPNTLTWADPDVVLSEAEERDTIARTMKMWHTGVRPVAAVEALDPAQVQWNKDHDLGDLTHTGYMLPMLGPTDMLQQALSLASGVGALAAWAAEDYVPVKHSPQALENAKETFVNQLSVIGQGTLSPYGPIQSSYPANLRRGEVALYHAMGEYPFLGMYGTDIVEKDGRLKGSRLARAAHRAVPIVGTTLPRYADAIYAGAPYYQDSALKAGMHTFMHLTGLGKPSDFNVEERVKYHKRDITDRVRKTVKEETGE